MLHGGDGDGVSIYSGPGDSRTRQMRRGWWYAVLRGWLCGCRRPRRAVAGCAYGGGGGPVKWSFAGGLCGVGDEDGKDSRIGFGLNFSVQNDQRYGAGVPFGIRPN